MILQGANKSKRDTTFLKLKSYSTKHAHGNLLTTVQLLKYTVCLHIMSFNGCCALNCVVKQKLLSVGKINETFFSCVVANAASDKHHQVDRRQQR